MTTEAPTPGTGRQVGSMTFAADGARLVAHDASDGWTATLSVDETVVLRDLLVRYRAKAGDANLLEFILAVAVS